MTGVTLLTITVVEIVVETRGAGWGAIDCRTCGTKLAPYPYIDPLLASTGSLTIRTGATDWSVVASLLWREVP